MGYCYICDGVRYLEMITNQPSWSGPFSLVVTSTNYGRGGLGSVPAVGTSGVTLSFVLHIIFHKYCYIIFVEYDVTITRGLGRCICS